MQHALEHRHDGAHVARQQHTERNARRDPEPADRQPLGDEGLHDAARRGAEGAQDRDVGALVIDHHDQHRHDIERRHSDDQQQYQRHHGLLDSNGAKVTGILLGPVAGRVAGAHGCAHRRHESGDLQRIGKAQPQPARALRQRRERPHVIEIRQDQRVVVVLQPGLKYTAHRELAQTRLGGTVGRGGGDQQRDAVTDPHPQLIGDVTAEDDGVTGGLQRAEFALHQQRPHIGDAGLQPGVDAPEHHGEHFGQAHRQCRELDVRRHPDHPREALQALAQGALTVARGHAGGGDVGLGVQRQQALTQLAFEAVHDRQDHDQRRDPQRHPGKGYPGDQRDEELVLARAYVTQTDED